MKGDREDRIKIQARKEADKRRMDDEQRRDELLVEASTMARMGARYRLSTCLQAVPRLDIDVHNTVDMHSAPQTTARMCRGCTHSSALCTVSVSACRCKLPRVRQRTRYAQFSSWNCV